MISNINKRYFLLAVSGTKIGKTSNVDIAVRCPICGDSQKNKNSTRLHLYHKNGKDGIQCFNGDCEINGRVVNVYNFLKNFYPNLLENYKRENFIQNMNHLSADSIDVFADIAENIKSNQQSIQTNQQKPVLTHNLFQYFENIIEHEEAISYLAKRGFDYFNSKYDWYFGKQDLKIGDKLYKLTNALIIPLYYGDEMYGFYSRNIYNKEFFTYMPEQNIGFKIFNWFQIDKKEETLITEGIFDCLSINYQNKIALMGAKIPEERLKELSNPIFVLDNDKTGILNSIEYAKRGFKVYIQPNDYREKDMNELMLNHPNLDIYQMIKENTFSGILAVVKLQAKL